MYETLHTDGKTRGRINYTVWSDIFSCADCGGEVTFLDEALDPKTKRVKDSFPCPHCGSELTKTRMDRLYETYLDPMLGKSAKRTKRRPVLINYATVKGKFEKPPDKNDFALLQKIEAQGCGRPTEGVVADLRGERVRVYPNQALRTRVQERFPNAIAWPPLGLPEDYLPLLAPNRHAFIQPGDRIVGHGGISLEELIVPFVRIE